MVLGVVRHANYRERLIFPIWIVDGELPSNGVLAMKEVLDHGFVDDGDTRGCSGILRFNSTSGKNGDSDSAEIIWSDIIFVLDPITDVVGVEAGNENGVIRFGARE